jgi:hypothetical protein
LQETRRSFGAGLKLVRLLARANIAARLPAFRA